MQSDSLNSGAPQQRLNKMRRRLLGLFATAAVFVQILSTSFISFAQGEIKMTPKEKQVVELLKAIETGASDPVGVINSNKYAQHNLGVADGLAGFRTLLAALPKGSAKVNTVRVF